MNKTRKISLLFTVLSLISSVSIIGTGFSIWIFGENEASVQSDVEVNVLNAYSFGDVHVYAPDIYYLEPTSDNLATYGGLVFYTSHNDYINGSHDLDFTLGSSVALSIKTDSTISEAPYSEVINNIEENLKCLLTVSFTPNSALNNYFEIKESSHEFSFKYDTNDEYPSIDFITTDAFNLNDNFRYNQDNLSLIDTNNNGIIDPNERKNEPHKGSVILSFEFSGL